MVKSAVRVETAPGSGHCAGEGQYAGIEKRLVDFALRLMKKPAEERRNFLAMAKARAGEIPDDEVRSVAIEFVEVICEAADKREGERRGA